MNPEQLARSITTKTKAVIPVHLYGQPADLDPILDIAYAHQLTVIEDACQAHGLATREKRSAPSVISAASAFIPARILEHAAREALSRLVMKKQTTNFGCCATGG